MRAYYDARAGEYDDWWLGRGLFADRDRPGWHEEVERVCEGVARRRVGRRHRLRDGRWFVVVAA